MNQEKEDQEITVIESQAVTLSGNPQERLEQGKEAAKALMSVAKPVYIQNQPYLLIGDWQTIGSFYGLFAGADEAEPIIIDNVSGFRAKAVVRNSDGVIISSAVALCMNEGAWKGREKFAQASMAQTRASSKALRNVVGWVAKLGGYKDTPAEEMDFQDGGLTKAHAEQAASTRNTPKMAENGAICPNCEGGMVDNRDDDGGAKLSQKGKTLIQDGKLITNEKGEVLPGCTLPLYKCADNNCKGVIWESNKKIEEELLF